MNRITDGGASRALRALADLDAWSSPYAAQYLIHLVPEGHPAYEDAHTLAIRVIEACIWARESYDNDNPEQARTTLRAVEIENADLHERVTKALEATPLKIRLITTPGEMAELRDELDVSPDWHEPDNQDVTMKVTPSGSFDNASNGGYLESHAVISQGAVPVAVVNMATLFALASGWEGLR